MVNTELIATSAFDLIHFFRAHGLSAQAGQGSAGNKQAHSQNRSITAAASAVSIGSSVMAYSDLPIIAAEPALLIDCNVPVIADLPTGSAAGAQAFVPDRSNDGAAATASSRTSMV
jgi:hypothetical protein